MKTNTMIVRSYAVLCVLFSLPAFFATEFFAETLRFDIALPGAKMEFFAAYGGLILGAGIFLAFTAKENARIGLLAILCLIGGLFAGRFVGLFVDHGTTAVQISFLAFEFLTLLIVGSRLKQPTKTTTMVPS
ncbi:hypothetical protein [Litoribacillus peritrichatus]|uniref:DUF4345 domain-containing protein n=1 Tax=Litoribacillus peritrichatus TaxID=718191 RepID=A0ABP7MX62_9GAMM